MEALSGLARSFFFAGARSLVVSHWYVESDAAVRIISDTVKGSSGPDATAAVDDSLRRAITGVVSQGGRHAHPAVWAPFVVVGAAR